MSDFNKKQLKKAEGTPSIAASGTNTYVSANGKGKILA